MALKGSATAAELRGKINSLDVLVIDAYGVAVRNGFEGTEKEWLESLKQQTSATIAYVDLLSANWQGDNNLYSQVVAIDGVNEFSKIDLNPSVEQLAIFHQKDIAFVTENEDGVVTVYCIGQKPSVDYSMQVTITGVSTNG